MEFNEIKEAILIGVLLSFMIGPVFFVLLQTSILKGIKAAIIFNIGVVLSDITFILIVYFGSRDLLKQVKNDPKLFLTGGIILIIYGILTYLKKADKPQSTENLQIPSKKNYAGLFLKGFLLNFINVGVLAFWLGTLVVMGPRLDMNPTKIYYFFALILVSYFTVDLGKIILAKKLRSKMTPTIIAKLQRILGVLLIVFGIVFALKGFI